MSCIRPLNGNEIKANRESIRALREAQADPKDLAQRVAKYQLWLARKKAGKLPPYEIIGRKENAG